MRKIIASLFVFVLLVGCTIGREIIPPSKDSSTPEENTDSQPTVLKTETKTITPSYFQTQTNTFSLSATPSPILTSTHSATPLPTQYPIQTLSSEQKLTLMDIPSQNEVCKLPCWNGITPGKSSSIELQGFFARLGLSFPGFTTSDDVLKGSTFVDAQGFPKGTLEFTQLVFYVIWSDGIVNELDFAYWDHPEQFTASRLGDKLGTPNKIYTAIQQGNSYSVAFHYLEYQLVIQIDGIREKKRSFDTPLPFDICLSNRDYQDVKVYLYSDVDHSSWPEMMGEKAGWEDWSNLLQITTNELFTQLQRENTCLPSN